MGEHGCRQFAPSRTTGVVLRSYRESTLDGGWGFAAGGLDDALHTPHFDSDPRSPAGTERTWRQRMSTYSPARAPPLRVRLRPAPRPSGAPSVVRSRQGDTPSYAADEARHAQDRLRRRGDRLRPRRPAVGRDRAARGLELG